MGDDGIAVPARLVACPTCGRRIAYSTSNRWRPFCSERCRSIDLGAWASERFRVPASPAAEDPDAHDESCDSGAGGG